MHLRTHTRHFPIAPTDAIEEKKKSLKHSGTAQSICLRMHDLLLPSVHVTLYSFHFHILKTRPSFVLPPLALFSISDSTPVLLMSLGQLFTAHCTTFIFCSHSSTSSSFLVLRKQTSANLRGTQHNTAVEQKQQDCVIEVKKLLFWSILTSP